MTYMDNEENIFKNDFATTDELGNTVSDLQIEQANVGKNIITKDISPSDLEHLEKVSKDRRKISIFQDHKVEQNLDNFYDLAQGVEINNIEDKRYIMDTSNMNMIDITNRIYTGPLATHIPKIVERFIINNTDHIFFGIHRLNPNRDPIFNNLEIIPDEFISLTNGGNKRLLLRSIIVWYNNHYVTFFQKKDIWYLYNDMYDTTSHNDYVIIIGDYNALLNYNLTDDVTVLTNSILLWYCVQP